MTLRYGLEGVDQLCCGNFGRIELLVTAARTLGRPELLRHARELAATAGAGDGYGLHCGRELFNPALFQGLSGIGYELLRLARPEAVPSVLLWA